MRACASFQSRERDFVSSSKGRVSAFLTLFGEKSHQRVRARKAPKPLRRALFSFHRTHKSLHFAIRRLFQTLDLRVTVYSRSNFTRARAFYNNDAKKWEKFCVPCAYKDAFPVLYCVTFWIACFLHPLQYVRRVFGICV